MKTCWGFPTQTTPSPLGGSHSDSQPSNRLFRTRFPLVASHLPTNLFKHQPATALSAGPLAVWDTAGKAELTALISAAAAAIVAAAAASAAAAATNCASAQPMPARAARDLVTPCSCHPATKPAAQAVLISCSILGHPQSAGCIWARFDRMLLGLCLILRPSQANSKQLAGDQDKKIRLTVLPCRLAKTPRDVRRNGSTTRLSDG